MITDFELHAFVDDQLAGEERSHVLKEIRTSQRLASHLAELQRLKRLVRSAYPGHTECSAPDANNTA
jgi:anti-sigma factor RsiW